jgi:desert hedgehog
MMDSDGDGITNGEELGDPCCLWTSTNPKPTGFRTTMLSHPGETNQSAAKSAPKCQVAGTTAAPTAGGTTAAPTAGGTTAAPTAGGTTAASDKSVTTTASTTNGSSSSSCFPGVAVVRVESPIGIETRLMSELAIGDRVAVGPGKVYSDVFMFTHKVEHVTNTFIRIATEAGSVVTATPGHYFPVAKRGLVPASSIQVGDAMQEGTSGRWTAVVSTTLVEATGLYNPQTIHGDIVVDGIVASTYTTAVGPQVAHSLLAPLRALYSWLSISVTIFERGMENGRFASLLKHLR